jgi:two-component system alkaline phosphatase synthesis response regulator PhoP
MPRILVVDDEPDILHLVSVSLSVKGYDVRTAKSKAGFFELLSAFKPDLIILDVMLGPDNGREICREIRAAEHKHIPIVLCSAVPEMLAKYEECNANDTLEKPFPLSLLFEKVNKLLTAIAR